MTQEVKVLLQLTLDVDTSLSKEGIETAVKSAINEDQLRNFNSELVMVDIVEIREEAEIYGNE